MFSQAYRFVHIRPPVAGACELDRIVRIPKFLSVETMGKRSSKVPVNRESSGK